MNNQKDKNVEIGSTNDPIAECAFYHFDRVMRDFLAATLIHGKTDEFVRMDDDSFDEMIELLQDQCTSLIDPQSYLVQIVRHFCNGSSISFINNEIMSEQLEFPLQPEARIMAKCTIDNTDEYYQYPYVCRLFKAWKDLLDKAGGDVQETNGGIYDLICKEENK